jgi:hypothetical protein
MASLSIFLPEGVAVGCANPIYPTGEVDLRDGATLTFEVRDVDCSSLKPRIGKAEQFGFESRVFYGELLSLESSQATDPALVLLGKPVMRGILKIHRMLKPEDRNRQN